MKPFYQFTALLFAVLFAVQSRSQSISLVKDLTSAAGTDVISYTESGGILYFVAKNMIWKTDGTAAGTDSVFKPIAGTFLGKITPFNGRIYFYAKDISHGYELWTSDGTQAGTQMLMDINPGASSIVDSQGLSVLNMMEFNSRLYFVANDSLHGPELWSTDGTAAGTQLAIDLTPGSLGGYAYPVAVVNNKLFFTGFDSSLQSMSNKLWYTTNGTFSGTSFVTTLNFGEDFISHNGRLYFSDFQSGAGIWCTDGTAAGTNLLVSNILSLNNSNIISDHSVFNNKLYLYCRAKKAIYATDGTQQGTVVVKDSINGNGFSATNFEGRELFMTAYNGKLYFSGHKTGVVNSELWASDGTPQGTQMFSDLTPFDLNGNPFSSHPCFLTVANGKMYFKARDSSRCEIWETDGTVSGTTKITDPGAEHLGSSAIFAAINLTDPMQIHNNQLFFTNTYYTAIGKELYKIDLPTAVQETTVFGDGLSIYPNPTTGTFTIDLKNNSYTTLTVLNQLGQAVYTRPVNAQQDKQEVKLDGLNSGVYFVRLSGKGKVVTEKIVIRQ